MIQKLAFSTLFLALAAMIVVNKTENQHGKIDNPEETLVSGMRRIKDSIKNTLPSFSNQMPTLLIKRNANDTISSPLRISKISLDVKVLGNIATTVMDITFYNDLDRQLDGEFSFPLGEGQTVNYFAMEMGGKLSEASVVEKAKGRTVYEAIVRRQVDPALLEWTKGNNFRSRVYPIPPKGYKRIVVGFDQELVMLGNSYVYYQPFFLKDKVEAFRVRTEVYRQEVKPELYGDDPVTVNFDKWKENWLAEKEFENYTANKPLAFAIPKNEKSNLVYVEKADRGNSAFYTVIKPELFTAPKKLPATIGILWDVSGSAKQTGISKILQCLDLYMEKASYPSVQLVLFSNEVSEEIKTGPGRANWKMIAEKIKSVHPDGGTQLGCLDLSKYKCEEFILVSDGMSNFGKHKVKISNRSLNCMVSSPTADFSYLKYLATATGGSFVNLNTTTADEGVRLLTSQHYRFISAEYDRNIVSELVPSRPVEVNELFSIAGMLEGHSAEITLNFGIGDKIVYRKTISVVNSPSEYASMVPKAWAQKKLAELDVFYEENENAITELGKRYGIVTRNTSLLVLDGIEDYITYKVEPKDTKMKKEYFERINIAKRNRDKEWKEHREEVAKQFLEWSNWYDKSFVFSKPKTEPAGVDSTSIGSARSDSTRTRLTISSSRDAVQEVVLYDVAQGTALGAVSSYENLDAAGATAYNWNFSDADKKTESIERDKMHSDITLGNWNPDAPYMHALKQTPKDGLYEKYLVLKNEYFSTPSFYVDVSDYFIKMGLKDNALRILSNLAELDAENHQLLRILAHRLQQMNEVSLAVNVFEDVLKIRGEEPQSYRDLGLALEQNKQYQEAADMLCKVLNRKWDSRFPEVESLVACELNHLIGTCGKKLILDSLDQRLIKPLPCDIRVVINWDMDNCDMDLWVTDPYREKCDYSHSLTAAGGKMSRDFTGGYGPEVFMIKKATTGAYRVEVNYYGTRNQSLYGPTTVQAELYTNYGRPDEKKKVITLRLEDKAEVVKLGELAFAN